MQRANLHSVHGKQGATVSLPTLLRARCLLCIHHGPESPDLVFAGYLHKQTTAVMSPATLAGDAMDTHLRACAQRSHLDDTFHHGSRCSTISGGGAAVILLRAKTAFSTVLSGRVTEQLGLMLHAEGCTC